jgi:hypothetical protein
MLATFSLLVRRASTLRKAASVQSFKRDDECIQTCIAVAETERVCGGTRIYTQAEVNSRIGRAPLHSLDRA